VLCASHNPTDDLCRSSLLVSIIVRHHLGDQFADDVEWLVSEDLEDGLYDGGVIEPIIFGSVLVRLARLVMLRLR
jgi:hypothetical protein